MWRRFRRVAHTPLWVGLILALTIPVTYALGFREMGHTLLGVGLVVGVIELYYKFRYDTTVSEEVYRQAKARPLAFFTWAVFMLAVVFFLLAHFWV